MMTSCCGSTDGRTGLIQQPPHLTCLPILSEPSGGVDCTTPYPAERGSHAVRSWNAPLAALAACVSASRTARYFWQGQGAIGSRACQRVRGALVRRRRCPFGIEGQRRLEPSSSGVGTRQTGHPVSAAARLLAHEPGPIEVLVWRCARVRCIEYQPKTTLLRLKH